MSKSRFFKLPLILFIFSALNIANIGAQSLNASPNKEWIKIYYDANGLNRINMHLVSDVDSIFYTREAVMPSGEPQTLWNIRSAGSELFTLPIDSIQTMKLDSNLPTFYITTDPYVDEIKSKEDYIDATVRYIPYGSDSEAFEQAVNIKGRGNTSWAYPKKPYRLKFDKKQEFANLKKAKSFVLLSNYIDNTLMRNAVAFKIAQMLNLPYTGKITPVNLVFNGMERGNYMLTNKIGINSGSVDIDEEEGILWELGVEMDEEFCFRTPTFNVPCMVKDPDFNEIAKGNSLQIAETWNYWQADIESAMKAVNEGRWQEVFDAEQLVKYFVINDIVLNTELEFPKSFYLYKESKDGKYKLGPVWDFDWSFGYHHDINRGVIYRGCGSFDFLSKIFVDSQFLEMFEIEFNEFCDNHLDELMNFIDDYAILIRDSALRDAMLWPQEHYNERYEHEERHAGRFDRNVENLKDWIHRRIEVIKSKTNFALY